MLVMDGLQRDAVAQPNVLASSRLNLAGTSVLGPVLNRSRLDGIHRPKPVAVSAVLESPTANILPAGLLEARNYKLYLTLSAAALTPLLALATYRQLASLPTHYARPVSAASVLAAAEAAAPPPVDHSAAIAAQSAGLQTVLDQFNASQTTTLGIYVKDLDTGAAASINPTMTMDSASLYKLFVANQIYQAIDRGDINPASAAGDTGYSITQCLERMIYVSDNDCGEALGTMLGWGQQNADLARQGFTGTSLTTLQSTSAQDVGLLLERVYTQQGLSAGSAEQFMSFLKEQAINNRLPAGLPAGTVVAHKTGDLLSYVHDAGIVYGPKTNYLVVVMSGPWPNLNDAPGQIADLSARLWAQFSR